ncbi:RAMP superfamily CRISPR-associated protein [Sphaerisporangium sp. NPDC051017]|uniref:RAMP superfamily CRISPR-associated protein n=1 Tax=Sphaerisporangium sp. NPDC051017 TaxID=3154636 RepID=UPI00342D02B5
MTARVGRHVTSRVRARGWLRTESPLHVGGLGGGPSEPLPIAVDGLGRLYVPGTTLAGVLRHWSLGADPDTGVLDELWGFVRRQGGEGQASRVVVADALITAAPRLDDRGLPADPLDPAILEFRPSVGIDRVTGTAAPEFLYGRAVVPAGYHIRLEMDIESHQDGSADEARMGALLAALGAGEVRIGAATGRGLGAVRLLDDPLDLVVDRFDSPAGLVALLRNDPARRRTAAALRSADPRLPARRDLLDVRVTWTPKAPVMVRAGTGGLVIDTLPLTTRVDRHHLTLVLPGGSVKGMLRSHAELVERTARCADAPTAGAAASPGEHSAAFRSQLDQLPAVRALFGSARDDSADRGAGALRAEECTALVTIPGTLWKSVTGDDDRRPDQDRREHRHGHEDRDQRADQVRRPDQSHREAHDERRATLPDSVRDRLEDLGMARADHVALDRWTGGAADGRLFSVLEPYDVDWEPIRLSVDLTRLGAERDIALALLLLTLRDLAGGRLPLGASTNRGFGDIEVTQITLTGGPWPDPIALPDALDGPEISAIARAWTGYLAQEVSS